jgi:hypothetical protein
MFFCAWGAGAPHARLARRWKQAHGECRTVAGFSARTSLQGCAAQSSRSLRRLMPPAPCTQALLEQHAPEQALAAPALVRPYGLAWALASLQRRAAAVFPTVLKDADPVRGLEQFQLLCTLAMASADLTAWLLAYGKSQVLWPAVTCISSGGSGSGDGGGDNGSGGDGGSSSGGTGDELMEHWSSVLQLVSKSYNGTKAAQRRAVRAIGSMMSEGECGTRRAKGEVAARVERPVLACCRLPARKGQRRPAQRRPGQQGREQVEAPQAEGLHDAERGAAAAGGAPKIPRPAAAPRACAACTRTATDGAELRRCRGCGALTGVRYCSMERCRTHWVKQGHRAACEAAQRQLRQVEAAAVAAAAAGALQPG